MTELTPIDLFRAIAKKAEADAEAMAGFPGSEYPAFVANAGLKAISFLEVRLEEVTKELLRLPKPPEDIGDGPQERVDLALARFEALEADTIKAQFKTMDSLGAGQTAMILAKEDGEAVKAAIFLTGKGTQEIVDAIKGIYNEQHRIAYRLGDWQGGQDEHK